MTFSTPDFYSWPYTVKHKNSFAGNLKKLISYGEEESFK